MDRGRWLAVLLLSGFVIGIVAWTLLRDEPEQVVSSPLASAGASEIPGGEPAPSGSAAIGDAGAARASTDAGVVPVAAAAQVQPAPDKPERPARNARDESQGGVDYLIETLADGKSFRVRARAAILLGRTRSERALTALVRALGDSHPGVRVAVASSLAKQGPAARAPLEQAATRERDRKVKRALESALSALGASKPAARPQPQPSATATAVAPEPPAGTSRYYVGIGKATDPSRRLSASSLGQVDAALRGGVARLGGVRIAPAGESPGAAKQVLGSDGRAGFYLDVSVASVTHEPGVGTRAVVNVMVGTYPGRDMRAMLKGAATLPGGADDESSRLAAVQGALQGALRKLPGVFAQAR